MWKRYWTFTLAELIFIFGYKCINVVVFRNYELYPIKF
jgi:hypothetical protein